MNWTYLQYGISETRQSIKGTNQNGPTVCMSFLKRACGCEYARGQIQNLILPSWILGMGVHCDIFTTLTLAGFIFWVIAQLDVYSGVSMRTMKVLFQQYCNYGGNMEIHFEPVHSWVDWNNRNRKQKPGARVKMAIRNSTVFKIQTSYEKESLQLKSLIPSVCQIQQHVHITLK